MLMFVLFAIAGVVYEAQDFLLYHPDHPDQARILVLTPAYYSLPYENLWLVARDGVRLNAFFIKQQGELLATAPTILFFHGNAGNIGDRMPHAQRLYAESHCNVFLLEYRGYGRSEGHVSEQGLVLDAQAALDVLLSRSDIDCSKIVVLGVSLGGAVATKLASLPSCRDKIMATVIVNSFTSIADMGACMFHPSIAKAPRWMLRNRFSSLEAMKSVTSPVLFVSGQCDQIVPPRMMLALHDACRTHKFFFTVPKLGHNNTFLAPYYGEVVRDFLGVVQGCHVPNLSSAMAQSNVTVSGRPLPPIPPHGMDSSAQASPHHRVSYPAGQAGTGVDTDITAACSHLSHSTEAATWSSCDAISDLSPGSGNLVDQDTNSFRTVTL